MHCPSCGAADTRVVDSRETDDGTSIRRRRACDACGDRFTTHERAESARIQVVKRDGARQDFDRRKLQSAVAKGASRALTEERQAALVADIEASIRQSGASEVSSQRVGEMVLERLAALDPMGYVRFKIVYSRLDDPDALYDELAGLVRLRDQARARGLAEQTMLPIAEPVPAAPARRSRRR